MTVDLFKYYKMLNQRAGRPPADPLKDEMAGIARYIVKEQPPRRSMLKAARILMRLEKQLATRCYFQTWYGNLTFAAIESGDFEINVPPISTRGIATTQAATSTSRRPHASPIK